MPQPRAFCWVGTKRTLLDEREEFGKVELARRVRVEGVEAGFEVEVRHLSAAAASLSHTPPARCDARSQVLVRAQPEWQMPQRARRRQCHAAKAAIPCE